MKIQQCTYGNIENQLMLALQTKQHALFWGINDKITVLHGTGDEYDEAYCFENNIRIFEPQYRGGTIISNQGDIAVGYTTQNLNSHWGESVYKAIEDYLKSKSLNVTRDNNDLLIDGYKFSGKSEDNLVNGMKFSAFFVSINSCDEVICRVCKKPRKKHPRGLGEYGITGQEIADLIVRFTMQNEDCLCNTNCEEVYNCEHLENCYFCKNCSDSKNLLLCNDTQDFKRGYAVCNRVVSESRFYEVLQKIKEQRQISGSGLKEFIKSLPEYKASKTVSLSENI